MSDFGYVISKTRIADLDVSDFKKVKLLEQKVSSFKRCISCGNCSATCNAGMFSDFDIRKIHSLFRRGQYAALNKELSKCMLCGKCTLVCPRDVNLRSMIINMREILAENP